MKRQRRFAAMLCILLLAAVMAGCNKGIGDYYDVCGTVLDENGSPVPGVTVEANGCYGEKTTQTDSSGNWALQDLIYTSVIHAEHPQMTFHAKGSTYSAWETWGAATGLDFVASPGFMASGWIRNEKGEPLAGVRVEFIENGAVTPQAAAGVPSGSHPVTRGDWYTTTNSNGYWQARLQGTVKIQPGKAPWHFQPTDRTVAEGPVFNANFSAYQTLLSDVADVVTDELSFNYGAWEAFMFLMNDGTTRKYTMFSDPYFDPVSGVSGATSIAAGYCFYLAISGGSVVAWGTNTFGQLGNGTTTSSQTPVTVQGLSGVTQIACGSSFSLALCADGTLWAWGDNGLGQLGDGNGGYNKRSMVPIEVIGISDVRALAPRDKNALALKNDGTVWIWGAEVYSIDDGHPQILSTTPVQVEGLSDIVAISSGEDHCLAVKSDGTVWAWGRNHDGELGDGSHVCSSTPVKVLGLTDVVAVSAGYLNSVALKSDGTVWTWGRRQLVPAQVNGIPKMVRISCGGDYAMGISTEGVPWYWSWYEDFGEWKIRATPVAVWP